MELGTLVPDTNRIRTNDSFEFNPDGSIPSWVKLIPAFIRDGNCFKVNPDYSLAKYELCYFYNDNGTQ